MLVPPRVVLFRIVGAQGDWPLRSANLPFLRPSFYVQPAEPPPPPPCPPRTPRGGLRPRGRGSASGRGFVRESLRVSLDKPPTLRSAPSAQGHIGVRPRSATLRAASSVFIGSRYPTSIDVLGRSLRFIPRASGAPWLLPVGSIVAIGRSVVGARPSPRRVARLIESFNLFGGGLSRSVVYLCPSRQHAFAVLTSVMPFSGSCPRRTSGAPFPCALRLTALCALPRPLPLVALATLGRVVIGGGGSPPPRSLRSFGLGSLPAPSLFFRLARRVGPFASASLGSPLANHSLLRCGAVALALPARGALLRSLL